MVRIAKETHHDGVGRIYLYPQELKVSKGTCVIWVNWVTEEKARLSFSESSKTCMLSTEFASGFEMKDQCILTNFLDYGQTVSLHFNEKGVFTYQLELIDGASKCEGKIEREGKIIVE